MSYEKQTWVTGDTVTAAKLNHMEDGIDSASSSGGGITLYGPYIGKNSGSVTVAAGGIGVLEFDTIIDENSNEVLWPEEVPIIEVTGSYIEASNVLTLSPGVSIYEGDGTIYVKLYNYGNSSRTIGSLTALVQFYSTVEFPINYGDPLT